MSLFKRKKTEDKKEEVKKEDKKAEDKKPVVKVAKKDGVLKQVQDDKKKDDKKTEKKADKKATSASSGQAVKRNLSNSKAYKILIKPLVTEKAATLGDKSQYVFEIYKKANKIEVARAIHDVYNIKPVSVNVMNMKGKKVNFGQVKGRRKDWKKAIVTLPKGKTIDVYEGI